MDSDSIKSSCKRQREGKTVISELLHQGQGKEVDIGDLGFLEIRKLIGGGLGFLEIRKLIGGGLFCKTS